MEDIQNCYELMRIATESVRKLSIKYRNEVGDECSDYLILANRSAHNALGLIRHLMKLKNQTQNG